MGGVNNRGNWVGRGETGKGGYWNFEYFLPNFSVNPIYLYSLNKN